MFWDQDPMNLEGENHDAGPTAQGVHHEAAPRPRAAQPKGHGPQTPKGWGIGAVHLKPHPLKGWGCRLWTAVDHQAPQGLYGVQAKGQQLSSHISPQSWFSSTALHSPRRQCIAVHSPHTSYHAPIACTHARKILLRKLFRNFSNFVTWRGGPSGWNSLCKNLKKWEKNPRKSCFLSFFVKNG